MPVRTLATFKVERVEVMDPDGNVDSALMPDLTGEDVQKLYRLMVLTRRLDERMFRLQRQGRLGTFARVLGQEGAHVGAVYALREDDWYVPAFRETGALLLRGVRIERILQMWGGDERGSAVPPGFRTLPVAVPVGTHMLHAVGLAWAMRYRGESAIALTSFGEGGTSEGDFNEAMNFAGVFRAPVVFLCQNNQWAISVPYSRQTSSMTVAQKAVGYGVPGVQVDGNDVFAVYQVTKEAVDRARAGDGPTLIEAHTYRLADHTTSDDARRYRSAEEIAFWEQRDPLLRLSRYMKRTGLLDDQQEEAIRAEADAEVAAAVTAAEAVPPPPPEEIFAHMYAKITPPLAEQRDALLRRLGRGS